jgi:hypothetical protein
LLPVGHHLGRRLLLDVPVIGVLEPVAPPPILFVPVINVATPGLTDPTVGKQGFPNRRLVVQLV